MPIGRTDRNARDRLHVELVYRQVVRHALVVFWGNMDVRGRFGRLGVGFNRLDDLVDDAVPIGGGEFGHGHEPVQDEHRGHRAHVENGLGQRVAGRLAAVVELEGFLRQPGARDELERLRVGSRLNA